MSESLVNCLLIFQVFYTDAAYRVYELSLLHLLLQRQYRRVGQYLLHVLLENVADDRIPVDARTNRDIAVASYI